MNQIIAAVLVLFLLDGTPRWTQGQVECFLGPDVQVPRACLIMDEDGDGDVDLLDIAIERTRTE